MYITEGSRKNDKIIVNCKSWIDDRVYRWRQKTEQEYY